VTVIAKMLSFVGFLLMISGMAGLILTRTLFSPYLPAVAAQVGAFALMIWARLTFGARSFHPGADPTVGGLVTTGPYRFVRHPIYTAVCVFAWAAWLGSPSIRTAMFAGVVTLGAVTRMLCEEHFLVRQYPEYADYRRTTKRMVPFVF
jgi:protein-S-isoprenylcysteine O-methyltransferase Ste14